ncbi:MAG: hypothetical protein HY052_08315 [Proteobacteria bacterium]|nr:hypothetical protein [Pseudomonadota bacterium]
MVAYRGVSKQDILNSIIGACELEQRHSPGPACDKEIDTILAFLPALQKVTDDASFKTALHSSNVSILLRMGELFETYAAENVDGIGRQVFKGLNAWGAFSGMHTLELRPMDEEINIYRFITGIRRIKTVDEEDVRELVGYSSFVTDENEIEKGIKNIQALVSMAQTGASNEELIDVYGQMGGDGAEGRIVRFAIEQLSQDPSLYTSKSLFDRYGVVLEDMISGAMFDTVQKKNATLIESVNKFLMPFFETDEVEMIGIGMITNDPKDAGGIMFCVTERVAQAVADAFPDQKVLRGSDNSVIAPSTSKPSITKQPKP